jgi:Zn-finger nucleic acid-binding protein
MSGMNCRNCGGAMELFATRGYFFCRYCGSFHFPETTGDDGIRILGPSQKSLGCAACEKPLASAMLDESFNVQYCENCRGVLLPRTAFATVVQKRRAWATGQPSPPVALDRAELERQVSCPSCRSAMATHPYYGPGNVVIDSCATCDLVWLDFGELKQIVAAPGRDRGSREQVLRSVADTRAGARADDADDDFSSATRVDLLDLVSRLF